MNKKSNWIVHKFGGTSVANADCMRQCIKIIEPLLLHNRIAIVVSAMGGTPKVTDLLLNAVHSAADRNDIRVNEILDGLYEKHRICVNELLNKVPMIANEIMSKIAADIKSANRQREILEFFIGLLFECLKIKEIIV